MLIQKCHLPLFSSTEHTNSDSELRELSQENISTNSSPFRVKGNRIISLDYFFEELKNLSMHSSLFNCNFSNIVIVKEHRRGLISKLFLKCNLCNEEFCVDTCPTVDPDSNNLNYLSIVGGIAIGTGFMQTEEFLAVLDILFMTNKTFVLMQKQVQIDISSSSKNEMYIAAMEAKEIAIAKGSQDLDEVPLLTVSADACFSKRTYGSNSDYSSLSGVASIIAHDTGKVIWSKVANKYCTVCSLHSSETMHEHDCNANYKDYSTGMEAELIVEGFKESEKLYGVRYSQLIADGDSSVYKKILDARPYKNTYIEKIECRNHLLRNFRKKMRELVINTTFPMKYRKILGSNLKRLSVGVTKAVKYRKSMENIPLVDKIVLLQKDFDNAPFHVFGQHTHCDAYFCNGGITSERNLVPEMQNCAFFEKVSSIVRRLRINAKSLLYDVDSNRVEHLHSLIAKTVGRKRVNFSKVQSYTSRAQFAVLQHNTLSAHHRLQKFIMKGTPKSHIISVEKKRHDKNLKRPKRRIVRKRMFMGLDSNYGESCEKPDMSPEETNNEKERILSLLASERDNRVALERETIAQANSPKWHDIRRFRITASNFGLICRAKNTDSYPNKVKAILYCTNISSAAIDYGKQNEHIAIAQLEKQMNIKASPSGIFIDETDACLAASPDGLIDGNKGIVEIKCAYASRNMDPVEAIKSCQIRYFKYDKDTNTISINKIHPYYYQVQGQLHISQRDYCLFCIFTSSSYNLKIERIERDDIFFENEMRQKLIDFYNKSLLPEIVDPRVNRNMPIRKHCNN